MKKMLLFCLTFMVMVACEESTDMKMLGIVYEVDGKTNTEQVIDDITWGLSKDGKNSRAYYRLDDDGDGTIEDPIYVPNVMDKPRELTVNGKAYYLRIQYEYDTKLYYLEVWKI